MATAAVRPAVIEDVEEIVRIQAGTWEAAYAEFVPAEALLQLRSPEAHRAWKDAVTAGGGHHVLVATEGEWTVGFCAAAPAAAPEGAVTPDSPTLGQEAWAEISTLLVEPRWGRRGHGGRLLAGAAPPRQARCTGWPGCRRPTRRRGSSTRAWAGSPTARFGCSTPVRASCARCASRARSTSG